MPFRPALLPLLVCLCACAGPNLANIEPTSPPLPKRGFYRGGVKVRRVSIVTKPHVRRSRAKKLRDEIVRQIEARFPRVDKKLAPILVDIDHTTRDRVRSRTGFLDIYVVLTMGLWPLAPVWGTTSARTRLTVQVPHGVAAWPQRLRLRSRAEKRYAMAFYSWFRAGPQESAVAHSNQLSLDRAAKRLAEWWPLRHASGTPYAMTRRLRYWPLRGRIKPAYVGRKQIRFDFDAKGKLVNLIGLSRYNSVWSLITDDSVYDEEERFVPPGSKRPSDTRAKRGFWRDYLEALTGLEAGYFFGAAFVSSYAVDHTGKAFRIASGKASSRGYKIRTFSPPTRSRLFIYPTLGFFSLDVDIADLAGDIPLGAVAGARDVGAIATDPATGARVDLGAPNVYKLKLRSGYVGQRVGGTMVFGNARTQLFATLEGGVNIFEWRWSKAEIGSFSESGHRAMFFHSFAARWMLGFVHRPWHTAVRCLGNYEVYRKFAFPQPLPFEGRVTYNSALQVYERREIKVDAAIVQSVNFYCGVSFHY